MTDYFLELSFIVFRRVSTVEMENMFTVYSMLDMCNLKLIIFKFQLKMINSWAISLQDYVVFYECMANFAYLLSKFWFSQLLLVVTMCIYQIYTHHILTLCKITVHVKECYCIGIVQNMLWWSVLMCREYFDFLKTILNTDENIQKILSCDNGNLRPKKAKQVTIKF